MSVSVAVMAHPRRASLVDELLPQLDREPTVVWDRHGDRWDTGRRALLAHDRQASHHLVVQDDAVVCRDLVAGLEQALVHVPTGSPVGCYIGRVRPYSEMIGRIVGRAGDGVSWLVMPQLHWGVAVVVPAGDIAALVAWCDRRTEAVNYDRRLSLWFEHQRRQTWYTWPSLVDHRQGPSMVPGRAGAGRRAYRFAGADRSAAAVDWAGRVLGVPTAGEELSQLRWHVVGHCVQVARPDGGRQMLFRGAPLPPTTPTADLRHLWLCGLIEPDLDHHKGGLPGAARG